MMTVISCFSNGFAVVGFRTVWSETIGKTTIRRDEETPGKPMVLEAEMIDSHMNYCGVIVSDAVSLIRYCANFLKMNRFSVYFSMDCSR